MSDRTEEQVWALVVAAGSGRRFGGAVPKQHLHVAGRPLLVHTLEALWKAAAWAGMVVAVDADHAGSREWLPGRWRAEPRLRLVAGGARRRDSVTAGLAALPERADIVLVHDGVRPRVSRELVERVIEGTREHGACVPVLPVSDTVKRLDERGLVAATLERDRLRLAQTPQGFRVELLRRAYRQVGERDFTDDAAVVEAAGLPVGQVTGDPENHKVTTPADLERLFPGWPRVGIGYDLHRLVPGRRLVLGGVPIDYELGAQAHSDGDVALHALMDALLGAAALGDIGRHFPDDDATWAGASSLELLRRVVELLHREGFRPFSADVTIVAERPRLAGHLAEMTARTAAVLGLGPERVNYKATTEEGLGSTGSGRAIAAQAVAQLWGSR